MANEKKTGVEGMDLGELGMIRNILMGQQISEWEVKYNELNDSLLAHTNDLEERISTLDKSSSKEMTTMERELSDRLEKLERTFEKRLENLETKMMASDQKDRQKIGKLLSEIGKKLLES